MSNFTQSSLRAKKWHKFYNRLLFTYGSCGASRTKTHSSLVKAQNNYTHCNLLPWELSNYIWHMTIWALWCFWHITGNSTKIIFQELWFFLQFFQQITQHYLGVFPFGYMHCKVQTKLSNDTYIASIKAVVLKIWLLIFAQLRGVPPAVQ